MSHIEIVSQHHIQPVCHGVTEPLLGVERNECLVVGVQRETVAPKVRMELVQSKHNRQQLALRRRIVPLRPVEPLRRKRDVSRVASLFGLEKDRSHARLASVARDLVRQVGVGRVQHR